MTIDLFLKSEEKTEYILNSLAEEIRELNKYFRRMESDIAIVKNVNNVLSKHVLLANREVWSNVQYSRRARVKISGIPASADHEELEPTVCKVLQHIGDHITEERIESWDRVNKSIDGTILKFSRRKDREKVMRLKSELKNLEPIDTSLPEGTKLFINESLCSY